MVRGWTYFVLQARGLLRRHVGGCAHHRAIAGQVTAGRRPGLPYRWATDDRLRLRLLLRRTGRILQPRQAEIHQQWVALLVEHDVGRLDVTMDNAPTVGVVQRPGQVANDLDGSIEVESAFIYGGFERLAFNKRRGNVVGVAVDAGLEDGHDVGVAKLSGRLSLAQETLLALFGVQRSGVRDLQGHFSVERGIVGPIDDPECPGPQLRTDLKPSQFIGCPRREGLPLWPRRFHHRRRTRFGNLRPRGLLVAGP